jgi:hypothetical protein
VAVGGSRHQLIDAIWRSTLASLAVDDWPLAWRRAVTIHALESNQTPSALRCSASVSHSRLCTAGFDSNAALNALGALCNYALGFGGAQAGAAPIEMPERIRELPPEEFPRLTAASDNCASHLSDQAFEFGLALLLGGLRSHLG